MPTLESELEENFKIFQKDWQGTLITSTESVLKHEEYFKTSYKRLASLQAWRAYILEPNISEECSAFFLEAQNDALLSHVQASMGCSRLALKSLRSFIENSLRTVYFMDHPIELILWSKGEYKIGVTEIMKYFKKHPLISMLPKSKFNLSGLSYIEEEYAKLSKAVHASSKNFRMTENGKAISFWSSEISHVSIWDAHEKKTIEGINLLLLNLFQESLKGTNNASLRESISFALPRLKDNAIKNELKVRIKR